MHNRNPNGSAKLHSSSAQNKPEPKLDESNSNHRGRYTINLPSYQDPYLWHETSTRDSFCYMYVVFKQTNEKKTETNIIKLKLKLRHAALVLCIQFVLNA